MKKKEQEENVCANADANEVPSFFLKTATNPSRHFSFPIPPLVQRPPQPSLTSRRLIRHTGHSPRSVILAAGPQVAADLRGFAKGHADARGAEEGVGGAVVFAEVKVHVGA